MVARPQSIITIDDIQFSLILQSMPPTFRNFNEHGTTKLILEEVVTDLFHWKTSTYSIYLLLIITLGILR